VTRYAVLVKGFPENITEKEVAEMFSSNYDLSKRQPYFPAGGLSQDGCRILSFRVAFMLVLLTAVVYYAHSSHNLMDDILAEAGFGYFSGFSKFLLNVVLLFSASFMCGFIAMKFAEHRRWGEPTERPTPQEIYEERVDLMVSERGNEEGMRASRRAKVARS
jgi:hypothetical protein